jgi:hypothetical protein
LTVAAVAFTAGRVYSQDKPPAPPSPEDMAKMMAEMAKPVKQHEQIAASAGEWDSECSMWMQPGAEPTKTKGSVSAKTVCNGLWSLSHHNGEMMGKPFDGYELFGYDKEKKQYFGVFVMSMGTAPEVVWGTSDDDGKTITLVGGEQQCMGMTYTPKWVIKNVDADHSTFEHWSKSAMTNNEYFKEMEIHSTRRSAK